MTTTNTPQATTSAQQKVITTTILVAALGYFVDIYDLLLFFITNKNRVVSKNSIAEHLWGDDSDQMDSNDFIYVHLRNLRKKLAEKGCTDYVQTIYGIGYNFKIN